MTIEPVELRSQFHLTLKHLVIFFLLFNGIIGLIMTVTRQFRYTKKYVLVQIVLIYYSIVINSGSFYCLHCIVMLVIQQNLASGLVISLRPQLFWCHFEMTMARAYVYNKVRSLLAAFVAFEVLNHADKIRGKGKTRQ